MTPLRQRMLHDLQLRGYSDRTVEAYVRAVAQLAKFYSKSPDRITEEEVRDYLLHLTNPQKVARGTHDRSLCHQVLLRTDALTALPRPRRRTPPGREETPSRAEP